MGEELQADLPDEGVAVTTVEDGSLAGRAGFRKGDVIVAINGMPIASTKDLERVTQRNLGLWEVAINRGGEVLTSVFGG